MIFTMVFRAPTFFIVLGHRKNGSLHSKKPTAIVATIAVGFFE